MKIVAIVGSPHDGNTLEKIRIIKDKLLQHKDVDFEIINLKDLNLKHCKGCFLCFIQGEYSCPLDGDQEKIFNKMEKADGVIFASPVYSMHISYLMKLFIDRFAYTFHRPCYFGKYSINVVVAGNIGLKETLGYLKMVAKTWGFDHVDNLSYRAAPKNIPMRIPPIKKDRTDHVMTKFYNAIKEKKLRKLTFSDYLTFKLMQTVYEKLGSMSPYDYNYWKEKGWFDKNTKYFYKNIKRNIFKEIFSSAIAWIFGRQIDKEFEKLQ